MFHVFFPHDVFVWDVNQHDARNELGIGNQGFPLTCAVTSNVGGSPRNGKTTISVRSRNVQDPVLCHLQVLLKNSGALPLRLDMSSEMFRLCSGNGKLENLMGLQTNLASSCVVSVLASEILGSEILTMLTSDQFSV